MQNAISRPVSKVETYKEIEKPLKTSHFKLDRFSRKDDHQHLKKIILILNCLKKTIQTTYRHFKLLEGFASNIFFVMPYKRFLIF